MTHLSRVFFLGCCFLAVSAHAAGDSPLHEAVQKGEKGEIETLLAKGADVNAKDEDGQTPLHWAASGKKDIVELLLAKGADVNAKATTGRFLEDRSGRTPLHVAAIFGTKDVVELLLAKGAEVNGKDNIKWTPLHWAASKGKKDIIKLLLAKGAEVNARSKDGWTPLHVAADVGMGRKAIPELLLAHGADINAQDDYWNTPFIRAVFNGDKDTAEWLLAHGADINSEIGWDRNTPLHEALERGDEDLARWLVAHGADAHATNHNSHIRPSLKNERSYSHGKGETPADVASRKISDPEQRRVMVTFLEKAAVASWQQSAGSSPRQALQKLVEQLKVQTSNQTLRNAILDLVQKLQPQPAVPPEAEHFEGRAKYMFKDGKSNSDMLDAAREYLKAMEIAPWIAGYYSDLCLILETANRPFEAQRACEFYLVAAPEAEDGSAVRMRIAGLGLQIERMKRMPYTSDGLDWLARYNLYR